MDADVGQSDIGPPCCIGVGILEKRVQKLSEVPIHSLYFVGNISPNRCMRECMRGVAAAVQKAKKCNADLIVVDSTGWIEGEYAKMFKLFEIRAIDPSLIVAIEREGELRHILPYLNKEVIKLRISGEMRSKTRVERRALREKAYNSYFQTAHNRIFEQSLLPWLPERGTLLGLFGDICNDSEGSEETLGLGILQMVDYESGKAVVFTPVNNDNAIRGIKPGSVKLRRVNGEFKEFKSIQILTGLADRKGGTLSNSQTTKNTYKG